MHFEAAVLGIPRPAISNGIEKTLTDATATWEQLISGGWIQAVMCRMQWDSGEATFSKTLVST